jgi:PEP-CTERM motif
MKNIASKLSAFAIAAAFTASAHAAQISVTSITNFAGQSLIASKNFGRSGSVTVESFDVTTSDGAKYLALCIDPATQMKKELSATYSVASFDGFVGKQQVQRLFSEYYDDAQSSAAASASFQLALWELYNDTGNKLIGTGDGMGEQAYVLASNPGDARKAVLNGADAMLTYALSNAAIKQQYTYTVFTSASSQTLVAATPLAAVPEPSSIAMLGVGLAAMGFVARRRSQR